MKKRSYIIAAIILIMLFLIGARYCSNENYIDIISTILAIIAAVGLGLEIKSNERINEAQLIMELNNQFVSNQQFTEVELQLEKYYAQYVEVHKAGLSSPEISFGIDLDKFDTDRQRLVNYLVHLEGVAALVNEGVLHLDVITDLMAYRYFIAVNNPVVQEKELLPYRNYYQGIFRIYENWSKDLGEENVPMAENALTHQMNSKK